MREINVEVVLSADWSHRHGYRLDTADKQWHLTSPTPYDPPLTYSGWQQAKNLGARIASIIREKAREDELAARQAVDPSARPKRKVYKVILHSSPFLRCIQTSIAIGAGLAFDSTPFWPTVPKADTTAPDAAPNTKPQSTVATNVLDKRAPAPSAHIRRSVLRIDAFLGEWLSPNYFEFITPPPESVMMLASAKADLLRREDYTLYPSYSTHTHSNSQGHIQGHLQGQLWSPAVRADPVSPSTEGQASGLGSMSALANSLPSSSSVSTQNSHSTQSPRQSPETVGYVPPVPHYAVNGNNAIPPGYVSHARDACVDIDYQWDSTRSPLDWGDGGEFPEEWPDMHKRFRTGVQSLVDWYSTAENPTRMVTKARKESGDSLFDEADDVEIESVVILVSHGAGCNALIGAITHQPVLLDVGMTSLTMAVYNPRKGGSGDAKWRDPRSPSGPGKTPPVHELYDMRLLADTDHIRSPAPTSSPSRTPSESNVVDGPRGRHSSFSTSSYDFSWTGSGGRGPSANTTLSDIRRDLSNTPLVPRISFAFDSPGIAKGSGVLPYAVARPPNLGRTPSLWSPILARHEDEDEDDIMLLNFSHEKPAAKPTTPKVEQSSTADSLSQPSREMNPPTSTGTPDVGVDDSIGMSGFSTARRQTPEPGQLGAGPGGLWGGTSPPDEADQIRDISASKRRWTVSERS